MSFVTFEELDAQLAAASAALVALSDPTDPRVLAVNEARLRLARRAEERAACAIVCQKCLQRGASVRLVLLPDAETFSCPVHGTAL